MLENTSSEFYGNSLHRFLQGLASITSMTKRLKHWILLRQRADLI